MTEKIKKALRAINKSRRFLGALPVLILGALLGIALYWGFSTDRETGSTVVVSSGHDHQEQDDTVWTCSMHPEVRLPRPGLCPKCQMKLIPLKTDAAGGVEGMRVFTTSENAKALMNIQTAVVERLLPTAEVRMVGKVEYDETRLAYITAWVPGRLDRLFVDYTGVAVKKGDRMVSIYSPELYSAQEELLQSIEAVQSLQRSDVDIVRKTALATVEAAREKLRLLGLTDEQVTQIEQRGKAEEHVTIYSPASGVVIHKNAQEGMYVQTGTRIYTIADLAQVWVKLDAYESDLSWLRDGQKVEFTSVSYPGETFSGTITFIDPFLNPTTRTVKVRVNVPNPQGKLKPEMFVNGVVHSQLAASGRDSAAPGDQDKPLVIPVSAALVTGTRAIVYVEKPDAEQPTYEGREIVLGPRAGDYYIVRRGLAEGELIVTRGNFKIDSALQIQAKPSMMTPEGGGGSSGHQHGEPSPTTGGVKQPQRMDLPVLFRQQLEQVLAATGKAQEAAQGEDVNAAQAAFSELDEAIKAVDMKLVEGHPHMVWMELSMRLGNDAFEGKEARTVADARRVAKSMVANAASLRSQFGLGHDGHAVTIPVEAVSKDFRQQLDGVFAGYFAMSSALAADDAAKATEAIQNMSAAVARMEMSLLRSPAHEAWMKYKAAMDDVLAKLADAKDIKKQREVFALLSDEAASLARRFPPERQKPYYLLRCPMAFDGRGGVWLQKSQQVRNPYFGAGMLECGDVQEIIRGEDAPTPATGPAEHKHE